MASFRFPAPVVCLAAVLLGACGSRGAAPSACDAGQPPLAVNRNGSASEGLAEVIVVAPDGEVELVTGDWVASDPSFSPDGRSLVVVRAEGDYESAGPESTSLWIVGIDGTDPRALTAGPGDEAPAWSPDGSMVAFSRQTADLGQQLMTVPSRGGEARLVIPSDGSRDRAPAWSADGRRLAFIRGVVLGNGSRATTVWVVDADGTDAKPIAVVPDAHRVEWHPDGESLLVSSYTLEDGRVSMVDVDTGAVAQVAINAAFAAWSPDGETIYYFTKDGAPQPSWWRLAHGRLVDGRLERETHVGQIEDYLYPNFGLAVSPCA